MITTLLLNIILVILVVGAIIGGLVLIYGALMHGEGWIPAIIVILVILIWVFGGNLL